MNRHPVSWLIALRGTGDPYRIDIRDGSDPDGPGMFTGPFSCPDLALLESELDEIGLRPSEIRRDSTRAPVLISATRVPDPAESASRIGDRLFRALVPGMLAEVLRAATPQSPVVLGLAFDDRRLAWLPWELMRMDGQYLSLCPGVELIRVRQGPVIARSRTRSLHLLARRASPTGYAPIPGDEKNWLDGVLRQAFDEGFNVREVSPTGDLVTEESLQADFHGNRVDLFHFSGHGNRDATGTRTLLVLNRKETGGLEVTEEMLPLLMAPPGRPLPRLVFLNTCWGLGMADALAAKGVQATVATQAPFSEAAARILSHRFYSEFLRHGDPIRALGLARRELEKLGSRGHDVGPHEWILPTLTVSLPLEPLPIPRRVSRRKGFWPAVATIAVALGICGSLTLAQVLSDRPEPPWKTSLGHLACTREIVAARDAGLQGGGDRVADDGACEAEVRSARVGTVDVDRLADSVFRLGILQGIRDPGRDDGDLPRLAATLGLFAETLDAGAVADEALRDRATRAFVECREHTDCEEASVFGAMPRLRAGAGEPAARILVQSDLMGADVAEGLVSDALGRRYGWAGTGQPAVSRFAWEMPAGIDLDIHRAALALGMAAGADVVVWARPAGPDLWGPRVTLVDEELDTRGRDSLLIVEDTEPAWNAAHLLDQKPGLAVSLQHAAAGIILRRVLAVPADKEPVAARFEKVFGSRPPCPIAKFLDRPKGEELSTGREWKDACPGMNLPQTRWLEDLNFWQWKVNADRWEARGSPDRALLQAVYHVYRGLERRLREEFHGDAARRAEALFRMAQADFQGVGRQWSEARAQLMLAIPLVRLERLGGLEREAHKSLLATVRRFGSSDEVAAEERWILDQARRTRRLADAIDAFDHVVLRRPASPAARDGNPAAVAEACDLLEGAARDETSGRIALGSAMAAMLSLSVGPVRCAPDGRGQQIAQMLADRVGRTESPLEVAKSTAASLGFPILLGLLQGRLALPPHAQQQLDSLRKLLRADIPKAGSPEEDVEEDFYRALWLAGISACLERAGDEQQAFSVFADVDRKLRPRAEGGLKPDSPFRLWLPVARLVAEDIRALYLVLRGRQDEARKQIRGPARLAADELEAGLKSLSGAASTRDWRYPVGSLVSAAQGIARSYLASGSGDRDLAIAGLRDAADSLARVRLDEIDRDFARSHPVVILVGLLDALVSGGVAAAALHRGEPGLASAVIDASRARLATFREVLEPALDQVSGWRQSMNLGLFLVGIGFDRLLAWNQVEDEQEWWQSRLPGIQDALERLGLPWAESLAGDFAANPEMGSYLLLHLKLLSDSKLLLEPEDWRARIAAAGTRLLALGRRAASTARHLEAFLLLFESSLLLMSTDDRVRGLTAASEALGEATLFDPGLGAVTSSFLNAFVGKTSSLAKEPLARNAFLAARSRVAHGSPAELYLTAVEAFGDLGSGNVSRETLAGLDRIDAALRSRRALTVCGRVGLPSGFLFQFRGSIKHTTKTEWWLNSELELGVGFVPSDFVTQYKRMKGPCETDPGSAAPVPDSTTLESALFPLLLSFLVGDPARFDRACREAEAALQAAGLRLLRNRAGMDVVEAQVDAAYRERITTPLVKRLVLLTEAVAALAGRVELRIRTRWIESILWNGVDSRGKVSPVDVRSKMELLDDTSNRIPWALPLETAARILARWKMSLFQRDELHGFGREWARSVEPCSDGVLDTLMRSDTRHLEECIRKREASVVACAERFRTESEPFGLRLARLNGCLAERPSTEEARLVLVMTRLDHPGSLSASGIEQQVSQVIRDLVQSGNRDRASVLGLGFLKRLLATDRVDRARSVALWLLAVQPDLSAFTRQFVMENLARLVPKIPWSQTLPAGPVNHPDSQ